MGKAGKLRKKRKNEELVSSCVLANAVDGDESDEAEDSLGLKKSNSNVRMSIAKSVFSVLSQRLDLYLDSRMKPLRKALYPIVQLQQGHFFEPNCLDIVQPSDEAASQVLSTENLMVAIQLLTYYAGQSEEYLSAEKKHLRKAIHPLVLHHLHQNKVSKAQEAKASVSTSNGSAFSTAVSVNAVLQTENSLTSRISSYFRTRQWAKALDALQEVYLDDSEVPKLGSVQRWVRECDVSAEDSSNADMDSYASLIRNSNNGASADGGGETAANIKQISLQLLYAVMKIMVHKLDKDATAAPTSSAVSGGDNLVDINCNSNPAECVYLPEFTLPAVASSMASREVFSPAVAVNVLTDAVVTGVFKPPSLVPVLEPEFKARIRVISHVPGPLRRPPVEHDLNIYTTIPHSIAYEPAHARSLSVTRHDVPGVPGAFVLHDALSVAECCQFILAAEHMQYCPDTVEGIEGVVWLGDSTIMDPIFNRVRLLIPQMLGKHELRGINARLRLFRYSPGAVYRPHIDGAWPGSGVLPNGEYTDDAFGATQHSRLTFLVYLSDGFTGGATTFFLPKIRSQADVNASNATTTPVANINIIEARSVRPVQGSVLCFPHGCAVGGLVHEGSAVHHGTKYVIRTDVLYSVA